MEKMSREQAKQAVYDRFRAELTPDRSGKGWICPICGSGSGDKGTGITEKDGSGHYTCWRGCYTNADAFDIIAKLHGIEPGTAQAMQAAYQRYGIELDPQSSAPRNAKPQPDKKAESAAPAQVEQDYTAYFLQAAKQLDNTNYHRGISKETLQRFGVGFDAAWVPPKAPNAPATPRLIIPTSRYSYLARDTRQPAEIPDSQKQYTKQKVGKVHLFNADALTKSKSPVWIVEGEIDALSIIDLGGEAVALGSTSNYKKLGEMLEQTGANPVLILAMDNDSSGSTASERLQSVLGTLGIQYIIRRPQTGKDFNDALNADREGTKRYIMEQTEYAMQPDLLKAEQVHAYKEKYGRAAHLQSMIDRIRQSKSSTEYPTGFENLDKLLDGGLYAGLYCVGAISSLGKTTFCLQIADQVARSGNDVLIFSLEMAADELTAKSISRLTYNLANEHKYDKKDAKTTTGILRGKRYALYNSREKQLINEAFEAYERYADHLYIIEGSEGLGTEQIRETVKQHISITGNRPVVMVDYLQIIAPYNERASDKQNTDHAVMDLKRISRDYEIPVVAISSFNRDSYGSPVDLTSFKESGGIEYSSDVVIALQYEGMDYEKNDAGTKQEDEKSRYARIQELKQNINKHAKDGEAVPVQLKVLKNRNGAKGDAFFRFIPMFNRFEESAKGTYSAYAIQIRGEKEPVRSSIVL